MLICSQTHLSTTTLFEKFWVQCFVSCQVYPYGEGMRRSISHYVLHLSIVESKQYKNIEGAIVDDNAYIQKCFSPLTRHSSVKPPYVTVLD